MVSVGVAYVSVAIFSNDLVWNKLLLVVGLSTLIVGLDAEVG